MKHYYLHWTIPLLLIGAAACGTSKSDEHGGHRGHATSGTTAASGTAAATAAKPHGGHEPAFGGLVLMDGHDHHAELVLDIKTGRHRVYVSDGARAPLPASAFDEVTLKITPKGEAAESLALTRTADNTHWLAAGKPVAATGTMVKLSYAKGGAVLYDVELPVEYVLTGKMPDAPAGATQAAATHGGQLAKTDGGHVELVADAAGNFQVWLLDADGRPRPMAGVTVKVTVSKKGYGDVSLAAKGDHFEGRGRAIAGGHATATVTVDAGGKVETASFPLHLESGGGGHGH